MTHRQFRNVSPQVREAATSLRRHPTEAEQVLWAHLRRKRLHGIKFRHQHAIGRFILDFYCVEYQLAIEIDGPIHNQSTERDAVRTDELIRQGIRVIRFTNEQVFDDIDRILFEIANHCRITDSTAIRR